MRLASLLGVGLRSHSLRSGTTLALPQGTPVLAYDECSMVGYVPILATRKGFPVYIPTSAESGTPVRTRLVEWLKQKRTNFIGRSYRWVAGFGTGAPGWDENRIYIKLVSKMPMSL